MDTKNSPKKFIRFKLNHILDTLGGVPLLKAKKALKQGNVFLGFTINLTSTIIFNTSGPSMLYLVKNPTIYVLVVLAK